MRLARRVAPVQPKRRAFTLLEILVVVAIICLLAALLFPAFGHVRALGRRTTCASNLKQIGMALGQYAQDYKFYPMMSAAGTTGSGTENPNGLLKDSVCGAWPDKVLPYLKSEKVFECPSAPNSRYLSGCPLADDSNPDHLTTFRGAYAFNTPNGSYFKDAAGGYSETFQVPGASPVRYTRPSSTILVLDSDDRKGGGLGGFVAPGYTQPPPQDVATLKRYGVPDRHEGGVNVAFADGHVKWMSLESLLKLSLWKMNGPE